MLNEYFTQMIDVIFEHNGILDKYIGDAIMALFGAPFPSEKDADNAVTVANSMITALTRLNRLRLGQGKESIAIGVGLNTGELIAGNIGSPKRMDYTVIGDAVNLAARLESATKYYQAPILLSEFTLNALKGKPKVRDLDLICVKGKNHAVAVYEALDHYSEEGFPNMTQVLRHFERGLRCYRGREWQRAASCFNDALAANPYDGPSLLYLERCRFFQESAPPADWDGTWTLQSK